MPNFRLIGFVVAGSMLSMPLIAVASDPVKTRIAGYRALGANFKAVNDSLRGGNATQVQMQALSIKIYGAAKAQYSWYPRGSGPKAGIKTAAKSEIWTKAAAFRTAQDIFAKQAKAFQNAALKNDIEAWKTASRKLGASCKGCHDTFRMESD